METLQAAQSLFYWSPDMERDNIQKKKNSDKTQQYCCYICSMGSEVTNVKFKAV